MPSFLDIPDKVFLEHSHLLRMSTENRLTYQLLCRRTYTIYQSTHQAYKKAFIERLTINPEQIPYSKIPIDYIVLTQEFDKICEADQHTLINSFKTLPNLYKQQYSLKQESKTSKNQALLVNQQLLSVKGQINSAEQTRNKCLALCAEKGYLELAKFLILYNANIHYAEIPNSILNPLQTATKYGHIKIVQLCLIYGAMFIKNDKDEYLGAYKIEDYLHDVTDKKLIQQITLDCLSLYTPLAIAAWYGHMDIVKLLLANNAFGEEIIQGGGSYTYKITPIQAAKSQGHHEIVNVLENYQLKFSQQKPLPQNSNSFFRFLKLL